MIIRTAKVSKRFGEFKYIYIMLCMGICEYAEDFLVAIIPQSTYYFFYIAVASLSVIMDALLIYF